MLLGHFEVRRKIGNTLGLHAAQAVNNISTKRRVVVSASVDSVDGVKSDRSLELVLAVDICVDSVVEEFGPAEGLSHDAEVEKSELLFLQVEGQLIALVASRNSVDEMTWRFGMLDGLVVAKLSGLRLLRLNCSHRCSCWKKGLPELKPA